MRAKRRTMWGLLAVIGVGLLLAACVPFSDAAREIGASQAGSTVELKVGEVLAIKLRGNPTTGYEWAVDQIDNAVLQQNGDAKFTPDSSATGSGGEVVTNFKALAAGQTQLKLIYQRPWLKDQPPADTFEVTVVVK